MTSAQAKHNEHERVSRPLYRAGFPAAEQAHSLILPVTNGCSWNACTFCEMYTAPQKKFRARDEVEVLEEIRRCGEQPIVQRVFLADGDALVLPTRRLLKILEQIRQCCRRCSACPATACHAICARSRSRAA